LSAGLSVFGDVLAQWMMPLFCVLSALSTYYALAGRSNRRYIGARFKRLMVPLLSSLLTHIPLQVYIERVSQDQFAGSFWAFVPRYFDGLYGFGGNFAWMGLHLWYLLMLFLFTLLALPLFRLLRRDAVQERLSWMGDLLWRPGGILALALPLTIVEQLVLLDPDILARRGFGGWSLVTYLAFFILGYGVACDERFQESIERHRWVALGLGAITMAAWVVTQESLLRGFNAWFWLVAILGFGGRHLRARSRFLRYANQAVLPFYILHQTIIVLIGFAIAAWEVSVALKYLVLASSSFVAIVALYELIVKRVPALRFLFGMAHKGHQTA
jgi:hypothetical protein